MRMRFVQRRAISEVSGNPTSPLERVGAEVVRCKRCPRLVEYREHIGRVKRRAYRDQEYWARPVPAFGDPAARLLIVGLAPAAHGANRTGRMFTGDRSGLWLYRALHRAGFASQPESTGRDDGLRLRGAYVTAACRCAPPDNRPSREELSTCRPFLVREIEALHARAARGRRSLVVLALGQIALATALDALRSTGVEIPRPLPRFGHLAEHPLPGRITLLCSYHPSQQNTQTGRLTEPMFDAVFTRAKALLD